MFGASEKAESCQIVGRCTSIEKVEGVGPWQVYGAHRGFVRFGTQVRSTCEGSVALAMTELRDQLLGSVRLLVGLPRSPNPRMHLREERLWVKEVVVVGPSQGFRYGSLLCISCGSGGRLAQSCPAPLHTVLGTEGHTPGSLLVLFVSPCKCCQMLGEAALFIWTH